MARTPQDHVGGEADLAALAARIVAAPHEVGLFCDFDGTLAPIVEDPDAARMPASLRPVLARLAERLGVLAVVSGRPATFLGQHAAVPGARLLGLYGLQEWDGAAAVARPEAAGWQAAVDAARERLRSEVGATAGVYLEDKGLSVAVHWRNADDRDAAARAVARCVAAAAEETGLAREPGKFVEELRPPVEWDKGAAVAAVVAERALRLPVYVGDDLGDLSAFRAVRRLGGAAVAVRAGAETPPALLAEADAVADGVDAVHAWLTHLATTTP